MRRIAVIALAAALATGCTVARQHTLETYDPPAALQEWRAQPERFWITGRDESAAVDTFVFTLRVEHPWAADEDSFPWGLELPVGGTRLSPSEMDVRVDDLGFTASDGARIAALTPHPPVWREGLAFQGRIVCDLPGVRIALPRDHDEYVATATVRWFARDDAALAAELSCRWEYLRVREAYLEPVSR